MPKRMNNVILSVGVNGPNRLFIVVENMPSFRQRPCVINLSFQRVIMKNKISKSTWMNQG